MKKFLYLFLFFTLFLLFNMQVSADTGTYQYLGTIQNCYVGSGQLLGGSDIEVYVYEINGYDFEIKVISGNRLRIALSPNYSTVCSLATPRNQVLSIDNPILNSSYTFTNSYTSYEHVYAYVFLSNVSGSLGSSSWGTDLPPEPEPEPEPLTFEDLIFIPEDDTYNKCYVVQSEDVIRAYNVVPALSTNYSYRDYYINSSYIYKDGIGSWSQYSTLPICLDSDKITHDFYYRLDFDKICIIFITLVLFGILLPIKIFSKILFGKAGL